MAKETINSDQHFGYTLKVKTGSYLVCARDEGIEVTQNGRLIFTSEGTGSNVYSHTLEAHRNPELKTIANSLSRREKELLACMAIRYPAPYPIETKIEISMKELIEKKLVEKAESFPHGIIPNKEPYKATLLGKIIVQRLI